MSDTITVYVEGNPVVMEGANSVDAIAADFTRKITALRHDAEQYRQAADIDEDRHIVVDFHYAVDVSVQLIDPPPPTHAEKVAAARARLDVADTAVRQTLNQRRTAKLKWRKSILDYAASVPTGAGVEAAKQVPWTEVSFPDDVPGPRGGASVREFFPEMVHVARILGEPVGVTFNGIKFTIDGTENPAALIAAYWDRTALS